MMAQVNAGRVRFVGRGEYNNSTQYYVFDLVSYNGNSYYAKVDTIGHLPTDTTYWQLVAEKGNVGPIGLTGNGISSITKTGTSGLVDTYTITFTNGNTTTFDVTNGKGIDRIEKTATVGNIDTYTIYFNDNSTSTFEVANGEVTREELEEEVDRLSMIYNLFPTTSDEDTEMTLDGTGEVKLKKIDLKGNTSQEVISGETGDEVNDTSIYVDDVNEDKENYITLKGNTYQEKTSVSDGDQYDSPSPDYPQEIEVVTGLNEIEVCGKNLFDKDSGFRLGYIRASDGVFISENVSCIFNQYVPVIANEKYKLTANTNLRNIALVYYDSTKTYISKEQASNTSTGTFTIPANVSFAVFGFSYNATTTITQDIIDELNIQLEQGSTATTYEEYKGQTYPISLDYTNLFKKQDISSDNLNKRLNPSGKDYNENGYFISPFIKVDKDTQYTINYTPTAYTRICYYASNNTNSFISRNDDTSSFTTPSTCQYLRFCNLMADIDNIRLEKGSTITNNYIELCNIGTYQDRIYKSNGNWYLHKEIGKVVLDGSESWNTSSLSVTGYKGYYINNSQKPNTNDSAVMSNYFKQRPYSDWSGLVQDTFVESSTTGFGFRVEESLASTADAWKTWLGTHNTTLYYVLATPTDTQITDTTLISQLNALYNATIHSTTHINTETSNLLPYINLKYNVVTPAPSPDRASEVEVVKGNNTITISNEDGTKTQTYNLTLGNLELCKIGDYQDYFYKESGNWYKHSEVGKVVLNGSESDWHTSGLSVTGYKSYYVGSSVPLTFVNSGKCNYFEFKSYNDWIGLLEATFIEIAYQSIGIRVVENLAPTLEDFKNWLSTHNTTVYYVLATPTTTQITDQLLVSQLDELQKAMSYYDKTLISQVNDSKPFILDVVAIRDLQDIFNI